MKYRQPLDKKKRYYENYVVIMLRLQTSAAQTVACPYPVYVVLQQVQYFAIKFVSQVSYFFKSLTKLINVYEN